ncbi:aldehyde dehydrogenase (NADP(+)) [Pantoea sp. BAV 3049]|uniref:aldehyde dehydrogenase (NADP(+)) n=1 Tax=Pantoea sp. BAV 3049 TaxID=2654188 RepID=UPI00131DB42F|nr:aldehyde dehydrogenase (NADP(+)) [Pantoea sp. BAV 3049]
MRLSGKLIIGAQRECGGAQAFQAIDPQQDCTLEPVFYEANASQIDAACQLAAEAFIAYSQCELAQRARFLRQIGENILALGDTLIERAMQETALPRGRIEGERGRTIGQLNMFADVVENGAFQGVIIESALPDRKPLPRPDLRQRLVALGPVAVFGASNFPLAFSVAGGDTASALAAGCPVVVKAHPAHPGTSELVACAIAEAVAQCGLPEGVFSLLHGSSTQSGSALVNHPAICAAGFTGSRAGGLALLQLVQQRPVPIPFYAEMSSINPLLLLPGALQQRAAALAQGFVDSLTLGCGQFCTNPGLVFALDGPDFDQFIQHACEALRLKSSATMLTPAIAQACEQHSAALATLHGVDSLACGLQKTGKNQGQPQLFIASAGDFINEPRMQNEVFGPVSLLVRCASQQELLTVLQVLQGQLTITLQLEASDYPLAAELLPLLEQRAGRLLANGFPTGVDVGYAMVHGGPYPATSDARTTSVGATAIQRFLRPVCYQDLPAALLPQSLQN